jgi:hypothetical protein
MKPPARASFYFYNTKAEVDRFVEVLKEIQKFFGQSFKLYGYKRNQVARGLSKMR